MAVDRLVAEQPLEQIEAMLFQVGVVQRDAGGDHRLRRDAVEEVGGAPEDVPLDERDLGAEAGCGGGRRVAGGTTADDDEPMGHGRRLPAVVGRPETGGRIDGLRRPVVPRFDPDAAPPPGSRDLWKQLGTKEFCRGLREQKALLFTDTMSAATGLPSLSVIARS